MSPFSILADLLSILLGENPKENMIKYLLVYLFVIILFLVILSVPVIAIMSEKSLGLEGGVLLGITFLVVLVFSILLASILIHRRVNKKSEDKG